MSGICYLDASAFVKLVVSEAESSALRAFLGPWSDQASSVVLDIETNRFLVRHGEAQHLERATTLRRSMTLLPVNAFVVARARTIGPPALRTIDAVHLATAAELGADLGVFVAYDRRLLDAAADLGLPVASPT